MDLLINSRNVYLSGKHVPGAILGFRDKIINKNHSLLRKALISLKASQEENSQVKPDYKTELPRSNSKFKDKFLGMQQRGGNLALQESQRKLKAMKESSPL